MLNYSIHELVISNEYQKSTKPLQQKLFNFQLEYMKFCNSANLQKKIPIARFPKPLQTSYNQTYIWTPKIKSKRLLSDPKFLLSLERKKIRAINGITTTKIEVAKSTRSNCFQGQKVRSVPRTSQRSTDLNIYKSDQSILQNTQIKMQKTPRSLKTPHLNFNLHHMLSKKKAFDTSVGHKIKGSNMPYYQCFFDKEDPITNRTTVKSIPRPSKTADICINRQ